MSDITKKSLTEITGLIKKKEIKSEEVTKSFINNIERGKKLNSFITNCSEQALEKAKKSSLVHANKVSRKKSRCSAMLAALAS